MFYKKLNHLLLALAIVFVASSQVSAQTQFIKYKKYLIPIGNAECLEMGFSITKPNVIYIDDIGEIKNSLGDPNNSPDPNGIQDLAIVLGLFDEINLLAIGVGIPGKGISRLVADSDDVDLVEEIVNKSSQRFLPQAERVPVLSGQALRNTIKMYADCGSSSRRLIVVNGGPAFDISKVLNETKLSGSDLSSLANKIRVIAVNGSNDDNGTHMGNSQEPGPANEGEGEGGMACGVYNSATAETASCAYQNISKRIGVANVTEITSAYFLSTSPGMGAVRSNSYMNAFYNNNVHPVLDTIMDSDGSNISGLSTTNKYLDEAESVNAGNSAVGEHYLRFGDTTAVFVAFGAWGCDLSFPASDQNCILDNVAVALGKAK